jgi:hydrogenase maturation factor
VTLIKGSTLYVTDASGNTVLVHTTAGSAVQKTVAATVKTVHPGDSVTVTGTQASDGSYSARQITIGGGSNG